MDASGVGDLHDLAATRSKRVWHVDCYWRVRPVMMRVKAKSATGALRIALQRGMA